MPIIKIDDREFDLDSLPDGAKQSINMLKLIEAEIQHLQVQLAIANTAKNAHLQSLKAQLPTPLEQVQAMGETIKLG
jgi:hypothetical protein